MSRCFPYPPPGYVRGGEISLAESFKLQKEKELEKLKKKEKKREHREKKDKKKRSRGDYEQAPEDKHLQKKRHISKETKPDQNVQCHLPDVKQQTVPEEQLEKSGLTEELGRPHLPYQCGSPDSSASEDSSKRRRVGDCQKTRVTQATGLRIRFALAKKEPEVAPVASSNIFRLPVSAPAHSPVVVPPAAVKPPLAPPAYPPALLKEPEVASVPRPSISKEQEVPLEPPSFSGRTESSTSQRHRTIEGLGLLLEGYQGSKKSRKKEAKFNELFLNWSPPPLLDLGCPSVEDDDEDWLFSTSSRQQRMQEQQQGTGICSDRSISTRRELPVDSQCSWPPRACHLEDADIYALPFVVPF